MLSFKVASVGGARHFFSSGAAIVPTISGNNFREMIFGASFGVTDSPLPWRALPSAWGGTCPCPTPALGLRARDAASTSYFNVYVYFALSMSQARDVPIEVRGQLSLGGIFGLSRLCFARPAPRGLHPSGVLRANDRNFPIYAENEFNKDYQGAHSISGELGFREGARPRTTRFW